MNGEMNQARSFDELLDKALRHYGEAEPLAGLERRVLAKVDDLSVVTDGLRRKRSLVWLGGLGVAAVVAVGVVLLLPQAKPSSNPLQTAMVAPRIHVDHSVASQRLSKPEVVRSAGRIQRAALTRPRVDRDEEAALPKEDVFPSAAPVDMFPRPVKGNEGGVQLQKLRSQKAGEALLVLRQEQSQPIQIAAIEIAPLQ